MKASCACGLRRLPCVAQIQTLRVYSEFTRIDPFGQ